MKPELLDTVNSIFFFSSSLFAWLNVKSLIKDKDVKGVRLLPGLFFAISTVWGIYFYTEMTQPLSVAGMALLSMANVVWITLATYYTKIRKKQ